MNDCNTPATTCPPSCNAPCAQHPVAVTLAEARERFDRGRARGVLDTGRYRMPYWTWGEGPPLLMIHGPADDSRAFTVLAALLSPHFRCVGYDLPGTPGDGADLAGYTHAHLVEDAFALLDHLDADKSYVLGSSLGSTVALAALHARPRRLPRAVLQAGVAHKPPRGAERVGGMLMRFWPGTMASLPLRDRLMTDLHRGPFGDDAAAWDDFMTYSGTIPARTVSRRRALLGRVDLRPLLSEVRQPVLLVCGDRDPVVTETASRELLQQLPSAGRVVLEGAGHVPNFTHAGAFAQVVRLFLTPPESQKCAEGTPCGASEGRIPIAECGRGPSRAR